MEKVAAGGAIENSVFLKAREGIGGENFGPLVTVIACGVTPGKNMTETVLKTVVGRSLDDGDVAPDLIQQGLDIVRVMAASLMVQAKVKQ